MKVQLGPLLNEIVKQDLFVNSPKFEFHGLRDMLRKYQAKATGYGVDPLGYAFSPFGYAGGQVLAEAVRATGGLDQDKLAEYMHSHTSRRWSARSVLARTANGASRGWCGRNSKASLTAASSNSES